MGALTPLVGSRGLFGSVAKQSNIPGSGFSAGALGPWAVLDFRRMPNSEHGLGGSEASYGGSNPMGQGISSGKACEAIETFLALNFRLEPFG